MIMPEILNIAVEWYNIGNFKTKLLLTLFC